MLERSSELSKKYYLLHVYLWCDAPHAIKKSPELFPQVILNNETAKKNQIPSNRIKTILPHSGSLAACTQSRVLRASPES